MKKLYSKAILLTIPFMLLGCSGNKTVNNFFDHNIVTIGRNAKAKVRLSDPRFNYQYSIKFITNQIMANISLGGGLAGKEITEVTATEDLYTIYVTVEGNSAIPSAETGTITIGPGAIQALNSEYSGSTFVSTFTMAESTEYK